MTTRIGTILPGKKLDPWSKGMEADLQDGADVIIVSESGDSCGVLTISDWHKGVKWPWYVNKANIRMSGITNPHVML